MSPSPDVVVRVDRDLCIGNAMCRSLAPRAFVADEGGQSVVADPGAEAFEDLFEAAALCPVGAISLENAASGEPIEGP